MAGIHAVGVEKVLLSLDMIEKRAREGAREALRQTLERVARQERTLLSLGWHPYGTPTGSVPPQPPWRISGYLSRTVTVGRPVLRFGGGGMSYRGTVGASAVYARIHEFGGWTGRGHRTYLPPRPHLRPAWRIVAPTVPILFYHEMSRFTRPPL